MLFYIYDGYTYGFYGPYKSKLTAIKAAEQKTINSRKTARTFMVLGLITKVSVKIKPNVTTKEIK